MLTNRAALALLLASACSPGSFSLEVSPASLTLEPGETRTVTVTAHRAPGFDGAIALSLEGIPSGVTVEAASVPAGSSTATVTLHNLRTGSPVVGVRAAVRSGQATATFSLTVHCPAVPGQTLSLLAGAPGGPGTADDFGLDARFAGPASIAGDGRGNLYVADTFNHAIRKVALATGEVTTVAGAPGAAGRADGIGAAARFVAPFGIARGGDFLYVADTFNHAIRKVDPATGAVTTVAGALGKAGYADGALADARFDQPRGLVFAEGNLFVVDSGNSTVRLVDLAGGFVETIAGTPGETGSDDGICDLSRFLFPEGITADGAGNLYVADSGNSTIRRIEIATEKVTTFAGLAGQTGESGDRLANARFNFPTGISFDGVDALWVADTMNQVIRRISLRTGDVEVEAGAPAPECHFEDPQRLCFPRGVAVEGGAVLIADTALSAIREITDGGLRIVAGLPRRPGAVDKPGPAARFEGLQLIASDGADTVYATDSANGAVRRITVSTGELSTAASGFGNPGGVAVDGDAIYVTDLNAAAVYRVAGNISTLVAGSPGNPGFDDGIGSEAHFFVPRGIVADGNGHLYVADVGAVRAIDLATRTVTTLAGSAVPGNADGIGAQAAFNFGNGIAYDGAHDRLWIADSANHSIRRLDLATRRVLTMPGVRFEMPAGLALDGEGTLYVSDPAMATVSAVTLASGDVRVVAGEPGSAGLKPGAAPARLNQPFGLALTGGGLVISDRAENVLLRLR